MATETVKYAGAPGTLAGSQEVRGQIVGRPRFWYKKDKRFRAGRVNRRYVSYSRVLQKADPAFGLRLRNGGERVMKELKKALAIGLTGRAAAEAMGRFRRQLKRWGLAMPSVQPLVLDFGLGVFYRTGLIEYWIANEGTAGYCGKYLFVFDGQTCPEHRHSGKHETFFVVKGRVSMKCGGRRVTMKAGDVLPVRSGVYHSFRGIGPALLLEISTPCEVADNHFRNPAIPIGSNWNPGAALVKEQRREK